MIFCFFVGFFDFCYSELFTSFHILVKNSLQHYFRMRIGKSFFILEVKTGFITGCKKVRQADCFSPVCTLSQNGYGVQRGGHLTTVAKNETTVELARAFGWSCLLWGRVLWCGGRGWSKSEFQKFCALAVRLGFWIVNVRRSVRRDCVATQSSSRVSFFFVRSFFFFAKFLGQWRIWCSSRTTQKMIIRGAPGKNKRKEGTAEWRFSNF